jgi:hypothetical protein
MADCVQRARLFKVVENLKGHFPRFVIADLGRPRPTSEVSKKKLRE